MYYENIKIKFRIKNKSNNGFPIQNCKFFQSTKENGMHRAVMILSMSSTVLGS